MEDTQSFVEEIEKNYKIIFDNGETLYIDNNTNIVYQIGSYYETKEINGKKYSHRGYQLEEVGKYDIETYTIIYDDEDVQED